MPYDAQTSAAAASTLAFNESFFTSPATGVLLTEINTIKAQIAATAAPAAPQSSIQDLPQSADQVNAAAEELSKRRQSRITRAQVISSSMNLGGYGGGGAPRSDPFIGATANLEQDPGQGFVEKLAQINQVGANFQSSGANGQGWQSIF